MPGPYPFLAVCIGSAAAIAPYFMYYNFGRVHQTLRVTATEAGVSTHAWSTEEIVALLG